VVYSKDGCRDQFNVESTANLRSQLRADTKFNEVKLFVAFPDGSPVENASVHISGKFGGNDFGSGFHTDKYGELTLPVPENMEFTVAASFSQVQPSIVCYIQKLTFNTEDGIRWRETDAASGNSPAWNSVATSKGPIRFVLTGPQCKPATR
jgi:hypothetical protein